MISSLDAKPGAVYFSGINSMGKVPAKTNMSEPTFTQLKSTLTMHCRVEVNIRATVELLWSILTDVKDYPRWNSTVSRIEGDFREGHNIRIHPQGSGRVFAPKISEVVLNERMTWAAGSLPFFKGVRTFEIRPHGEGTSDFIMEEDFSGVIFALVKGSLPDFRPIFIAFANDLKKEAERDGSRSFLRHQ